MKITFIITPKIVIVAACRVKRFRRQAINKTNVRAEIRYYLEAYGVHFLDEDMLDYSKNFPEIYKQAEEFSISSTGSNIR